MNDKQIAVLLTCHNRRKKTLTCLCSFFEANKPCGYKFDIYLVDDGSTDGTSDAVKKNYPDVVIIKGDGNLFWAGGMRLAWKSAIKIKEYDVFLLLNDDVVLYRDFIDNLIKTEEYSLLKNNRTGIYSGATIDSKTKKTTYGGYKIKTNHFVVKYKLLNPTDFPQKCELANANILWISKDTIDIIGIFDEQYTHGIADFDYSMQAVKNSIPVYLAPNIGGECVHDHGDSWRKRNVSLSNRIAYLKSPKGIAYKEYLYYIKKHFPMFLPYSFVMLWMKTLFPELWERFKK